MIAELIEHDVKISDEQNQENFIPRSTPLARHASSSKPDNGRMARLESDYSAKMAELRAELRQARQTEDRLHDDRNYWRAAAEEFPQDDSQDHDEEPEEEEEGVPPSESPTNILDLVDLVVVMTMMILLLENVDVMAVILLDLLLMILTTSVTQM